MLLVTGRFCYWLLVGLLLVTGRFVTACWPDSQLPSEGGRQGQMGKVRWMPDLDLCFVILDYLEKKSKIRMITFLIITLTLVNYYVKCNVISCNAM